MTLRQRHPRVHDKSHLEFVRLQPCCVCGSTRMIEAAHVRYACPAIGKDSTGLQEKPSDCWTVSLCAYHHRTGVLAQHKMSEPAFWQMHGLNPFEIAARLWIASGGAERELQPKPTRRPKASKPRKEPGLRRKIMPGRPLQSRGFQTERRT